MLHLIKEERHVTGATPRPPGADSGGIDASGPADCRLGSYHRQSVFSLEVC